VHLILANPPWRQLRERAEKIRLIQHINLLGATATSWPVGSEMSGRSGAPRRSTARIIGILCGMKHPSSNNCCNLGHRDVPSENLGFERDHNVWIRNNRNHHNYLRDCLAREESVRPGPHGRWRLRAASHHQLPAVIAFDYRTPKVGLVLQDYAGRAPLVRQVNRFPSRPYSEEAIDYGWRL
jgi:hypothetical protein